MVLDVVVPHVMRLGCVALIPLGPCFTSETSHIPWQGPGQTQSGVSPCRTPGYIGWQVMGQRICRLHGGKVDGHMLRELGGSETWFSPTEDRSSNWWWKWLFGSYFPFCFALRYSTPNLCYKLLCSFQGWHGGVGDGTSPGFGTSFWSRSTWSGLY
jgi:hypothetical protein